MTNERLIHLEHVTNRNDLEKLGSALTFEGLDISEDNLNQMYDWLEDYTTVETHTVYYVDGQEMNEWYDLTGNNAYPDNLHIVMLDLSDMHNPNKIVLARFDVGGRWLDDVIANNTSSENSYEDSYEDSYDNSDACEPSYYY